MWFFWYLVHVSSLKTGYLYVLYYVWVKYRNTSWLADLLPYGFVIQLIVKGSMKLYFL